MLTDRRKNMCILTNSSSSYLTEFESYLQKTLLLTPYVLNTQYVVTTETSNNTDTDVYSKYVKLKIYDTTNCNCHKGEKIYNITIKRKDINNIKKIKKKILDYKINSVPIDYDMDKQSLTVRGTNEYNLHLTK
jgi:hypothetical protein